MRTGASALRFAALGLLVPLLAGCSKEIDKVFNDNIAPEVRLTAAPITTTDQYFYAYRMNWVGYDPDGRVEYFLISIDPPDPGKTPADGQPDSIWSRSSKNEEIIFFKATKPDTVGRVNAIDYHTFAIAAVDNNGKVSKSVWRSFNSYTQAPFVFIEDPHPNEFFTPIVTPAVRIHWRGIDPDGQFTTKPIKYKFKLFRPKDPDFPGVFDPVGEIISEPRMLRWKYAPTFGPNPNCTYCSYWDSSSAETTEVQYTNLIPNNLYLFAVTGFDEAGAYDPVFSQNSNLLRFAVTYAGSLGPTICMFNEFFQFCYPSGGYASDPTRYFNVEVPADQRVTFNWLAIPPAGADIRFYRWCMDINDLTDETPRYDENLDWYHWSRHSLLTTSATVGKFVNNGEEHLFYIEAEDNNGLRSLGIIRFTVVRATFDKEPILFVDDTRLTPDQLTTGGGYAPPRGQWPSAAELDTFFFARGNVPWRGYPDGTLTKRGIFDGYDYDTIGTRGILSGIMPLARLGLHHLVVWYTDDISSTYTGNPVDLLQPITSLRLMSSPGQPSTISTYMRQGGKVWMFGGGAGYATLAPWQKRNTPPDEFTNTDGELISGRFMYDFGHWQQTLTVKPASFGILNTPTFTSLVWPPGTPEFIDAPAPGRGYTAHGLDRNLSMPPYGQLDAFPPAGSGALLPRSPAEPLDDPSPLRNRDSFYYVNYFTAEFMGTALSRGAPNYIREDADPNPDRIQEESTLDTLYLTYGLSAPPGRPMMTYYHGFTCEQMVFCGFALWHFTRPTVQQLGDFVLQQIFGMTKAPPVTAPARVQATTVPRPTSARPQGRVTAAATRR
jgi:hypothetical protein